MRLIDADALLLELELLQDEADAKYHETDFDSFYGGGCSMIQEVIKGVEKQPTAFDVDKVVSELEKDASRYTKKYVTPYGNNGYRDTKAISIHKAIDIVKRGGKE